MSEDNRIIDVIPAIIICLVTTGFALNKYQLSVLAFCISGVWMICSDNEKVLNLLFLLVSFAAVFKVSPSSTSLFTIIELCASILFIYRNHTVDIRIVVSFLIFFSYIVCTDIIHGRISVVEYLRQFVSFCILAFCVSEYQESENKTRFVKKIVLSFSIGLFASSIVGLFSEHIPSFYSYFNQVGYNYLIQSRFLGLNGDPNYYSINVIIALLGLLLLYSKGIINRLFWLLFVSLALIGTKTYSKSYLLMLIVIMLFFVALLAKNHNYRGMMWLLVGFCVALFFFVKGKIPEIGLILSRFTDSDSASTLTTGRSTLWSVYLTHISSNPGKILFGEGIGANYLAVGGVHNWYIECLYYFGIIGVIGYYACYLYCLRLDNLNSKVTLLGCAGFVVLCMMYFFLQMVFSNELPFHFSIAYLILTAQTNDVLPINTFDDTFCRVEY